jgi:serine/threonine protein kinase
MGDKIFFEHYRLRSDDDAAPQEVRRSGAAIIHEAVDLRSNEPVTLQLVPLASVDPAVRDTFLERARVAQQLDHVNIAKIFAVGVEHDFIALVTEHPEGETAETWVLDHGPMAPSAALRAGLQVVRALAAAAYFSLTHRAIQPSNILFVPGQAPDGGWPFVKLLNFGIAGLESHADSGPARELAPSVAPQFASPEQLQNGALDFRSEMYSLAATLCLLLTGAAPLAVSGLKARFRLRRLPELRRVPRAFRQLLTRMLSRNPDNRPQDPVALEDEMLKCLTKLERRESIRQKLGIPMTTIMPRSRTLLTPGRQIFAGSVAFVLLLLTAAAIAAFLLPPDSIPFLHASRAINKIGVPVGVPENATTKPVAENSPVARSTIPSPPPNAVATNKSAPPAASAVPQIAAAGSQTEPEPPTEGPDENTFAGSKADSHTIVSNTNNDESLTKPSSKRSADSEDAVSSQSRFKSRSRIASSQRSRFATNPPDEVYPRSDARVRGGSFHAKWIGSTSGGRRILRLPSGRIVVVTPGAPDQDYSAPRRRVIVPQSDGDEPPAPRQPFLYPPND